jgi:hypothetical protein
MPFIRTINYVLTLVFTMSLLLASCTKTEEVYVPDNIPPPDMTISEVKVENYINKVHISLLGREATDAQMTAGKDILHAHNLSADDRIAFLHSVMEDSMYLRNIIDYTSTLLIRAYIDSNYNNYFINRYTLLLADTANAAFFDQLHSEIDRYRQLNALEREYMAGVIKLPEVQRRLVNNSYYDEINMGTTNFVISCFETFFFRSPTSAELLQGETMVDGFYSQLLFEEGRTKEDFLQIFFNSDSYYEGQVRDLFKRYLYREPTSEEIAYYTARYKGNTDYKDLQSIILSLNEYIGL